LIETAVGEIQQFHDFVKSGALSFALGELIVDIAERMRVQRNAGILK
jgi:hypothetical protein